VSKVNPKSGKKKDRPPSVSGASSKTPEEKETDPNAAATNFGGFVVMCMLMVLMLYAVHCTWVTSNAYSSPSVVLASTNYDG
jgi:dolichyl-diphosphooligosaccharide--protein glycosyltransferase